MLCYFLLAFMISDEKPAVMLKFLNLQIYAFCQNLEISAITSLSTFSAMYSFSSFCYSFTVASQHFFFFLLLSFCSSHWEIFTFLLSFH